jgi:hypothetical protein
MAGSHGPCKSPSCNLPKILGDTCDKYLPKGEGDICDCGCSARWHKVAAPPHSGRPPQDSASSENVHSQAPKQAADASASTARPPSFTETLNERARNKHSDFVHSKSTNATKGYKPSEEVRKCAMSSSVHVCLTIIGVRRAAQAGA